MALVAIAGDKILANLVGSAVCRASHPDNEWKRQLSEDAAVVIDGGATERRY